MSRTNDLLDELAERPPAPAPTLAWVRRRAAIRRRQRRLGMGVGAVAAALALMAGVAALGDPSDQVLVEAVDEDAAPPGPTTTVATTDPSSDEESGAELVDEETSAAEGAGADAPDTPACGPWPEGLDLGPMGGTESERVEGDDQIITSTSGGRTVEIRRPPRPQERYALDDPEGRPTGFVGYETYLESDVLDIDATGEPETVGRDYLELFYNDSNGDSRFPIGEVDAGTFADVELGCAAFSVEVYEDGALAGATRFDFTNADELVEVEFEDGTSFSYLEGPRVAGMGALVTEIRPAAEVPGSIGCGGAEPASADHRVYRIDDSVPEPPYLADAVASGHLVPIDDPVAAVATAERDEVWVVAGGWEDDPGGTLSNQYDNGYLSSISASSYTDFIAEKETGPTAGGGGAERFAEPVEALAAFLAAPASATFIQDGWVEMPIDDTTYAYGVPFTDHGEDGWITVLTVEGDAATGWAATGWTSAGC